jgi:hypothetical protein
MDLDLNQEQRLLRDNVRRFAERELNADVQARDRAHEFSRAAWDKCGELRLQGLPVPQPLGGAGLDPLSCAVESANSPRTETSIRTGRRTGGQEDRDTHGAVRSHALVARIFACVSGLAGRARG